MNRFDKIAKTIAATSTISGIEGVIQDMYDVEGEIQKLTSGANFPELGKDFKRLQAMNREAIDFASKIRRRELEMMKAHAGRF